MSFKINSELKTPAFFELNNNLHEAKKKKDCCIVRLAKSILETIGSFFRCLFCCKTASKSRKSKKRSYSSSSSILGSTSDIPISKKLPKPSNSNGFPPKPIPLQPKPILSSSPNPKPLVRETPENTRPLDVIYGNKVQDSDPRGKNSCAFQSVCFLEALVREPNAPLDSAFIDQIIDQGVENNALYNPTYTTVEPHNVPLAADLRLRCVASERNIHNYIATINEENEYQSFFSSLNLLFSIKEYRMGAITLRNESYGIFLRGTDVLFFNSHATQQKEQSLANVKIFSSIQHLSYFLAYHYKFIKHEMDSKFTPELIAYAEALDNSYEALTNNKDDGTQITNIRNYLAPLFENTAFTTDLINNIIECLLAQRDFKDNARYFDTLNQVSITPFVI